jgi:hypothetical protein
VENSWTLHHAVRLFEALIYGKRETVPDIAHVLVIAY